MLDGPLGPPQDRDRCNLSAVLRSGSPGCLARAKRRLPNTSCRRYSSGGGSVEVLDGDTVRRQLSAELGFSRADPRRHVRRIGAMAHLLTRNGVVVIVAAVSPYAEARRQAREQVGAFVEVHVHCPIEACERRDVKGMYAKARASELTAFTGVDDPYEPSEHPEVTVSTLEQAPAQSAGCVFAALEALGYLSAGLSEICVDECCGVETPAIEGGAWKDPASACQAPRPRRPVAGARAEH